MVTDHRRSWLLLVYSVPREPSAARVAIWRKLKRLGSIAMQDAVWVLPSTPRTAEELRWLTAEIVERGGEARLWEGRLCLDGQDEQLETRFVEQVEQGYGEIVAALEQAGADLLALSRRYQQVRGRDYFNSAAGQRAREALLAAGEREARCSG